MKIGFAGTVKFDLCIGNFGTRARPSVKNSPHDPAVQRLAALRETIAQVCRDAGRASDAVTLVAVSKTFSADAIEPVIAAGQRVFGENRVQEAKAKWPAIKGLHPDVALHLVGPLQSN